MASHSAVFQYSVIFYITFIDSFKEDCMRRDFTMNALLMNYEMIIDYVGGIQDLENMNLRFIYYFLFRRFAVLNFLLPTFFLIR